MCWLRSVVFLCMHTLTASRFTAIWTHYSLLNCCHQCRPALHRLRCGMANNCLHLNASKTALIGMGSSCRLPFCMVAWWPYLTPVFIHPQWFVISGSLSMRTWTCYWLRTSATLPACRFHLYQLWLICRSLTLDCVTDWTTAMFPSSQLAWLQSVLRAAAHLVLGLPDHASVSAAMHDYLQRTMYKLCLLTFKCLQPACLSRFCVSAISIPPLWLADRCQPPDRSWDWPGMKTIGT